MVRTGELGYVLVSWGLFGYGRHGKAGQGKVRFGLAGVGLAGKAGMVCLGMFGSVAGRYGRHGFARRVSVGHVTVR